MSATNEAARHPRAGRPRDPATDRAITAATFRLLREEGYRGLSVEAVAAEAGVAKTTIYRRYRSKRELVVASVVAESEFPLPPPDLPPRDAYAAIMRQGAGMLINAGAIRILGTVLAEEDREPELLALARARLLEPRREFLLGALRSGVELGEIRPDANLDLMTEMTFGAVIAHHIRGEVVDDAWIERLAAAIWSAAAPHGTSRAST